MTSKIKSYKGFNADLTCRGFQYEVGKEYNHTGAVSACNSGFHACENPMDVLGFYPPCDDNGRPRRYCEVEQSGNIDRGNDSKVFVIIRGAYVCGWYDHKYESWEIFGMGSYNRKDASYWMPIPSLPDPNAEKK